MVKTIMIYHKLKFDNTILLAKNYIVEYPINYFLVGREIGNLKYWIEISQPEYELELLKLL